MEERRGGGGGGEESRKERQIKTFNIDKFMRYNMVPLLYKVPYGTFHV